MPGLRLRQIDWDSYLLVVTGAYTRIHVGTLGFPQKALRLARGDGWDSKLGVEF